MRVSNEELQREKEWLLVDDAMILYKLEHNRKINT
jgi:hypothetical protein